MQGNSLARLKAHIAAQQAVTGFALDIYRVDWLIIVTGLASLAGFHIGCHLLMEGR
jgi:hypothetical protein